MWAGQEPGSSSTVGSPDQPGPQGWRGIAPVTASEPGEKSIWRGLWWEDTADLKQCPRAEAGPSKWASCCLQLSTACRVPNPNRGHEAPWYGACGPPLGHRAPRRRVDSIWEIPSMRGKRASQNRVRQTVRNRVPSTSEATTVTSFLAFQKDSMYIQSFLHKWCLLHTLQGRVHFALHLLFQSFLNFFLIFHKRRHWAPTCKNN